MDGAAIIWMYACAVEGESGRRIGACVCSHMHVLMCMCVHAPEYNERCMKECK